MVDILSGIAEFLHQKGLCIEFLDRNPESNMTALLVSSRSNSKKVVKCRLVDGFLRIDGYLGLPSFSKTIDLVDSTALPRTYNVMKKYLLAPSFITRGGIDG